jgi:hypothetical protein
MTLEYTIYGLNLSHAKIKARNSLGAIESFASIVYDIQFLIKSLA